MRWVGIALAVVLILGGAAYYWKQNAEFSTLVRQEAAPMAQEIAECKHRLRALYSAWQSYRKSHHGQEPPSIEALLPRYVRSPELLVCPTYRRLQAKKRGVDLGRLRYRGKEYPVTYGFRWLTAANAIARRRFGEQAPLIVCPVHREVISRYVFGKDPGEFTLTPATERRLNAAGATGKMLVLQRDGKIIGSDDL